MIIVGYQGIGKTSLCTKSDWGIDLESSNFWIPKRDDPTSKYRHDDWYEAYCNVAEDLSRQGHNVFVSSHEPVRKRLQKSEEIVVAIAPAPTTEMESIWIDKLKARYEQSNLEKDMKALKNAEARYKDNVKEIFDDIQISVMIHDPNYNLADILFILNDIPCTFKTKEKEYVKYAAEKLSSSPHAITAGEWEQKGYNNPGPGEDAILPKSAESLNRRMKEFATSKRD